MALTIITMMDPDLEAHKLVIIDGLIRSSRKRKPAFSRDRNQKLDIRVRLRATIF